VVILLKARKCKARLALNVVGDIVECGQLSTGVELGVGEGSTRTKTRTKSSKSRSNSSTIVELKKRQVAVLSIREVGLVQVGTAQCGR